MLATFLMFLFKAKRKLIFEHSNSQAKEISNILKDISFKNIMTSKDFKV